MKKKQFVTVAEFARRVDRTERIVRYWINAGLVATRRANLTPHSRILIPVGEVERVLAELLPADVEVIDVPEAA